MTMPATPPEPTHPYHPLGLHIPAYETNEAPVPVLLAALAGTLAFAVLLTALVARKLNPRLSASGLAVFCWFTMSENDPFHMSMSWLLLVHELTGQQTLVCTAYSKVSKLVQVS